MVCFCFLCFIALISTFYFDYVGSNYSGDGEYLSDYDDYYESLESSEALEISDEYDGGIGVESVVPVVSPGYNSPGARSISTVSRPIASADFLKNSVKVDCSCLLQSDIDQIYSQKSQSDSKNENRNSKGSDNSVGIEWEDPDALIKKSFKELQEERMQRAKETLQKEMIVLKFRLGPTCEAILCGTCKILVEEFAKAVLDGIDNPELRTIESITLSFCNSKDVEGKYSDSVSELCISNFLNVGYLLIVLLVLIHLCRIR